jgi:poly-gamma-glutamate biosynthesis protein PgsC/CapC
LASIELSYSIPLLRLAILIGVVLSIVVYRFYGWSTGGFVTAGYLALFATRPLHILWSLVMALATLQLVTRVIMPRVILWGRRKFAVMIICGTLLTWGCERLVHPFFEPWPVFDSIGILIPALIANDAQRQGYNRTVAMVLVCAVTTYGLVKIAEIVWLAAQPSGT